MWASISDCKDRCQYKQDRKYMSYPSHSVTPSPPRFVSRLERRSSLGPVVPRTGSFYCGPRAMPHASEPSTERVCSDDVPSATASPRCSVVVTRPERVVLNLCSLVPAPAVGGFQPSVGSATDTRETSAGGPRTAPRPPLRGTMPFTPKDGAAACSRSCPSGDCDIGAFFVCKWYAHTSTIDAGPQDTARHVVNILCTAAVARLHLTDADPRADAMALFRSEREDTGERIHQIWTVTARNFDDITFDAVMFQTFRAAHAVLIHVIVVPCAGPAWEHGAPPGLRGV